MLLLWSCSRKKFFLLVIIAAIMYYVLDVRNRSLHSYWHNERIEKHIMRKNVIKGNLKENKSMTMNQTNSKNLTLIKRLLVLDHAATAITSVFSHDHSIPMSNHLDSPPNQQETAVIRDSIVSTRSATKLKEKDICKPVQYVLFLKTHKTGSSTITNIFNRYADAQNLTILLPRKPTVYSFNWPNKFRLQAAANTYTRPNFLANHARYSRDIMNEIFPRVTSFYISILRNPVSQWESTFQYFKFAAMFRFDEGKDPLESFLDNPPPPEELDKIKQKYPSLNLVRNPQFYDLGLDHRQFDNITYIKNAILTLESDFNFILLMEHFDESLTLMRRRFCWEIDDVVYFKLNERLNKDKRKKNLSPRQRQQIKQWNNADTALYEYFEQRFWNDIKEEGDGFYEDVKKLKDRRHYYKESCIEKSAVEEAYFSVFVKGYKMRSNLTGELKRTCERMLKSEIHFVDYFREVQKEREARLDNIHIESFSQNIGQANITVKRYQYVVNKHSSDAKKTHIKKANTEAKQIRSQRSG